MQLHRVTAGAAHASNHLPSVNLLALRYQQGIVMAIRAEVCVVMLNDQQRAIAGDALLAI